MLTSTDLLGLVDQLYEAAAGGASWEEAIGAIVAAFGRERGGIFIQGVGDDDVFDADFPALLCTAFYAKRLHSANMGRHLQADISFWAVTHCMLAIGRSGDIEPFDGDAMSALATLWPHLVRAGQMRDRLAEAAEASRQALDALGRIGQAVLLVDAQARPVHQSEAAIAILRAGDSIRLEQGELACARQDETRELRRLIGMASIAHGNGGRLAIRRDGVGPPLSALVLPWRGQHSWSQARPATAMVVVNDPLRATPTDAQHLRELYGLTPAEARTALALLDADRLQDIADRFGVSLSAVRLNLQRAFEKTGTHRQAELVRLLLTHRLPTASGPAPVATALHG